jgi:hypothetical protein
MDASTLILFHSYLVATRKNPPNIAAVYSQVSQADATFQLAQEADILSSLFLNKEISGKETEK